MSLGPALYCAKGQSITCPLQAQTVINSLTHSDWKSQVLRSGPFFSFWDKTNKGRLSENMAYISLSKYIHTSEIWLLYRTQSMNTAHRTSQSLWICSLRAGESHEMSGISKFLRSAFPQDTAVQSHSWAGSRAGFLVLSCCVELQGHSS